MMRPVRKLQIRYWLVKNWNPIWKHFDNRVLNAHYTTDLLLAERWKKMFFLLLTWRRSCATGTQLFRERCTNHRLVLLESWPWFRSAAIKCLTGFQTSRFQRESHLASFPTRRRTKKCSTDAWTTDGTAGKCAMLFAVLPTTQGWKQVHREALTGDKQLIGAKLGSRVKACDDRVQRWFAKREFADRQMQLLLVSFAFSTPTNQQPIRFPWQRTCQHLCVFSTKARPFLAGERLLTCTMTTRTTSPTEATVCRERNAVTSLLITTTRITSSRWPRSNS